MGGYFHSENMHVVERMQRVGDTLTWQATIDDPDVLLKPWTTVKRTWMLNPNPKAVLRGIHAMQRKRFCSHPSLKNIIRSGS